MALIKRVLLFFLSLVGIIVLLIGATTSYAQDNYEADTLEPNFRFYTIEWLDIADNEGRKYVCGTKVSTFDYSGRKYNIEYFYLLTSKDTIVTQFIVDAIQLSVDNPETRKMEELKIKLYASVLSKDGKDFLAGMRGNNDNDKSVGAEYTEFDREGNTKIFKDLYKGGFDLKVHHIPGAEVTIPIEVNTEYAKEKEQILENCIVDLINNQEHRIQSSISIDESIANRVG